MSVPLAVRLLVGPLVAIRALAGLEVPFGVPRLKLANEPSWNVRPPASDSVPPPG